MTHHYIKLTPNKADNPHFQTLLETLTDYAEGFEFSLSLVPPSAAALIDGEATPARRGRSASSASVSPIDPSRAKASDDYALAFLHALSAGRPFTSGTLFAAFDPDRASDIKAITALEYARPDQIPLEMRWQPYATAILRRLQALGWVRTIGRGRGLTIANEGSARGGWGHCYVISDAGKAHLEGVKIGRSGAKGLAYAKALGAEMQSFRDAAGRLSAPVEKWRENGGAV